MKLVKKIGVILSMAAVGSTIAITGPAVSAYPAISISAEAQQTLESVRLQDANKLNYDDSIKRYAESYINSGYKVFDLNTLKANDITLKNFKNLDGDGILVVKSYSPTDDIVIKKMSNEEFLNTFGGSAAALKIPNRYFYDSYGRLETEVLYDSVGEIVVITHHRFNSNAVEFVK